MSPLVGIVVVNHNLKKDLRETLQSIAKIDYPNFKVVVCDNASTDGSVEMVKEEFPAVRVIANQTERGYAGATNQGLRLMVSLGAKYVFSTSNDVIVSANIITELVSYAEANPKAGIMGSKIYFHNLFDVLWHAGGNMVFGHSYHYGYMRSDSTGAHNRVRECKFVTGCGYFLRSSMLEAIGFLDENLVFYSEDADLCFRARAYGYGVVFVPSARMWHKVGTTLAKNRPVQLHYSTRNALQMISRHKLGLYPLSLWVYLLLLMPAKMAIYLLMGRKQNAQGILRGTMDWAQQRMGWI